MYDQVSISDLCMKLQFSAHSWFLGLIHIECLRLRVQLFPLMFVPRNVNSSVEISGTHSVADTIAVADANVNGQCKRVLIRNMFTYYTLI